MTIDNSRTIISLRIKLFIASVAVLTWLALAYLGKVIKFPLLGMSDISWTILFTAIWIVAAFLPMFLNYQFISFSDDKDKIIFRYFSAGIVGGKKNSVEIDKRSFAGYEVEERFFGRISSIILLQRFKEGIAKYPPIYISALSVKEKEKVFRMLNLYSPRA